MKHKEKICLILLKYIPIICAILMFLHIITLLLGYILFLSEVMVLTLVTLMIIFWSITFKFCLLHNLASLYTLCILWCCYIQRFIGFGEYLNIYRIFFLIIGFILFVFVLIKYVRSIKKITFKDSR